MPYDMIRRWGTGLGEWALAQAAGSRALPVLWIASRRVEATYRRVRAWLSDLSRVLPLAGLPWAPGPPEASEGTAAQGAGVQGAGSVSA